MEDKTVYRLHIKKNMGVPKFNLLHLHDAAVRIQNRLPLFASNVFIPGQFRSCSELRMFLLNDAMWLIIAILQIGQILSGNDISREWKEIVSLNACCRFGHMARE